MRTKMNPKVWLFATTLLASLASATAPASAQVRARRSLFSEATRAVKAIEATDALDYAEAEKLLEGADLDQAPYAVARARLFFYQGECDKAAELLARPDVVDLGEAFDMGDVVRGCARAMAGTVTVRDEERGVVVRLQDDEDRALVPLLVDVALKARATLAKDLGVELPLPLRIDLVRDQFTLAAMTGLPEEAAQKTGTVAIAKWGRVTMLSPRATQAGYGWLDTLAHELTHLALEKATGNHAPLWLQEGVAKREEVRWREKGPLDDFPPVDSTAAVGMDKGLGLELDKLGPSLAMLPSASQAAVAYAQVESFVHFWTREAGDEALPQLLVRLKAAEGPNDIGRVMGEVSNGDFAMWVQRWKGYMTTVSRRLPEELEPGATSKNAKEISSRSRLGELFQARGHVRAASIERARVYDLAPHFPSVRCQLAESLLAMGDTQNASPLVERIEDVHARMGRWYSLHGLLHPDPLDPDKPFRLGLELDPLEPSVACEEKAAPEIPKDPIRAAICEAARRVPR